MSILDLADTFGTPRIDFLLREQAKSDPEPLRVLLNPDQWETLRQKLKPLGLLEGNRWNGMEFEVWDPTEKVLTADGVADGLRLALLEFEAWKEQENL